MEGTPFQGLSIEEKRSERGKAPMTSVKDAQRVLQEGTTPDWGKLVQVRENKYKEGLGFVLTARKGKPSDTFEPI
ncbi:receptor-like kinase, partial [Trifolium medium]|nr:receptor-like kinase [Trifolium medium]